MAKVTLARYQIHDLTEGQRLNYKKKIHGKDVDCFSELSGDISPLHMVEEFARERGFRGRVVHGALLISYLSKLIGVDCPGENCLLQSMDIRFVSPVYINDEIEFQITVDQISLGVNTVVLKIKIVRGETVVAKGRTQIGFTSILESDE